MTSTPSPDAPIVIEAVKLPAVTPKRSSFDALPLLTDARKMKFVPAVGLLFIEVARDAISPVALTIVREDVVIEVPPMTVPLTCKPSTGSHAVATPLYWSTTACRLVLELVDTVMVSLPPMMLYA